MKSSKNHLKKINSCVYTRTRWLCLLLVFLFYTTSSPSMLFIFMKLTQDTRMHWWSKNVFLKKQKLNGNLWNTFFFSFSFSEICSDAEFLGQDAHVPYRCTVAGQTRVLHLMTFIAATFTRDVGGYGNLEIVCGGG